MVMHSTVPLGEIQFIGALSPPSVTLETFLSVAVVVVVVCTPGVGD